MAPYKLECNALVPLNDNVLVKNMEFADRTVDGIILLDDDGTLQGIRPRWGQVYAVGPTQFDIKVGQWILISHGRWTRGVEIITKQSDDNVVIRRVDIKDILVVGDTKPND